LRLCRPRQWGGCWLALSLWRELGLDGFWGGRLPPSRKGTRWDRVLLLLATYRLLAPGSEWRLHREWFERSAMADLLGEDPRLAEIHKLSIGEGPPLYALAGRPAGSPGQAISAGRRTLCLRSQRQPRRQGAGNASTPTEMAVGHHAFTRTVSLIAAKRTLRCGPARDTRRE